MTTAIKVCFIVGTLGRGGSERQLLYMLKVLKSVGISPRVLCLTNGEPFEQEIKSIGVPVEWIGESKNQGVRLLKIINNLRKNPADILQSSHFYTNIYAGLAGKISNIPSIGAIRSDFRSVLEQHQRWGAWQVSLPSFLIVNSEEARRGIIKYGTPSDKVGFVRNVVESEWNGFNKDVNSKSPVRILFVGRLDDNKCPDQFVRLAAVITKKFSNLPLHFQIVGDGVLKSELEKLAEKLGLSLEKLSFLGVRSDMNAIYEQGDILISTSKYEGTSNVILEAMAYGIPVIATKVGGTPEILNEDRGILIEHGNKDELVEATITLISDEKLRVRLGSEGRKYVGENHSLEDLQAGLVKIYEKLLG